MVEYKKKTEELKWKQRKSLNNVFSLLLLLLLFFFIFFRVVFFIGITSAQDVFNDFFWINCVCTRNSDIHMR